jgi:tetratricopeptide (TPR) repeat protein
MSRVVAYSMAAALLLGPMVFAQGQSSQNQSPQNQPSKNQSSKDQSSKDQSPGPPASSTSDNPDDLLNSPMTPPRSTDEGAKTEPQTKTDQTSKPAGEEFPFPEEEEKGNYSSSKDTQGDLSAPANDASHPGADVPVELPKDPNGDITEVQPWNPHEADKDVEVGIFYFNRWNYKAAEARFRDALKWDRNHAEANYRLATVLEKENRHPEAAIYYEAYLKILPQGHFAGESRKALSRIDSGNAEGKKNGTEKAATSPPS